MSDRGLPSADGSPACPFVAFEDDRDERADRPDHRHRCFAEAVPAPRALAHQEAYCLSSAFPVCPTFQDWARREAAQARSGRASAPPVAATVSVAAATSGTEDDDSADGDDRDDEVWGTPNEIPIEERPRRNPPRDWAAPPPWAAGAATAGGAAAGAAGADAGGQRGDDPLRGGVPEEGRGLAGSAADRLASGEDPDRAWTGLASPRPRPSGADEPSGPAAPPDPELAGLVGRRGPARPPTDIDDVLEEPRPRPTRRPTVSSTRDRSRERDRGRVPDEHDAPSWEHVRRYEAYPSIKARAGLPNVPQLPRMTVLIGALLVAALLLFLLPTVLNIGGRVQAPGASASPSAAAASASLEPTPVPAPTPQIYTIKSGDALARIARRFGLTLEQIMAANPEIKDANRIKVGDKIVIPTPPPEEVPAESTAPSASP